MSVFVCLSVCLPLSLSASFIVCLFLCLFGFLCLSTCEREINRYPFHAVAERRSCTSVHSMLLRKEEVVLSIPCCCGRKRELYLCPFYAATEGRGSCISVHSMLLLKEEGAVSLSILCCFGRKKDLYRWPVYAVAEGTSSSVHFMLLQKEEGSVPLLRKEEGAVPLSILCCCGRKKELYRWPVYAVAEGRGSSVHFMLLQKEEGSLPLLRKEEGAVSLASLCCCRRKR